MNITILGSSGMLGSMVSTYLRRNDAFTVLNACRQPAKGEISFDAEHFTEGRDFPGLFDCDYLINCIGVIKPYCQDHDAEGVLRAITVNGLFPHMLAESSRSSHCRIIQIATDCVYSGEKGKYIESDPHDVGDVYGRTKSLGEVMAEHVLHIRCSIIGPEQKSFVSLMEWFLHNAPGSVLNGFSHHLWNGVTTLQFAQLCEKIIRSDDGFDGLRQVSPIHHFLPNDTVNKFELLELFQSIFETDFQINEVSDQGPAVDRTLSSEYRELAKMFGKGFSMEAAIRDLKRFMRNFS